MRLVLLLLFGLSTPLVLGQHHQEAHPPPSWRRDRSIAASDRLTSRGLAPTQQQECENICLTKEETCKKEKCGALREAKKQECEARCFQNKFKCSYKCSSPSRIGCRNDCVKIWVQPCIKACEKKLEAGLDLSACKNACHVNNGDKAATCTKNCCGSCTVEEEDVLSANTRACFDKVDNDLALGLCVNCANNEVPDQTTCENWKKWACTSIPQQCKQQCTPCLKELQAEARCNADKNYYCPNLRTGC